MVFHSIGGAYSKTGDSSKGGVTFGGGLVVNHKNILEVLRIFNPFNFEPFSQDLFKNKYDVVFDVKALLYSHLKAHAILYNDVALRIYF